MTDRKNNPNSFHKSLPQIEEEVLGFWNKEKIFEKSLKQREESPLFSFYDGPPFANGLPHYGHILAMSIKDLFVRYKTLRGYYVPRRNGWDCHGLPVEFQLEKELGISGKKAIENFGIAEFNKRARQSVMRYADTWTRTMKRMGRWLDFDNTYKTYESSYIESVWWVFGELWDKGLVYKDFTSQPYCPRCETSLSNFETTQGYRDNVPDPSVYIKFSLTNSDEKILAWTTTPWTLPANTALAVDEAATYGLFEVEGERIWLAVPLASRVLGEDATPHRTVLGKELVGRSYKPLFEDFYAKQEPVMGDKSLGHMVWGADFVSMADGTGIVHVAPAYGEDDMTLAKKHRLPAVFSTNSTGTMLEGVPGAGMFLKDADKHIIDFLKDEKDLFRLDHIKHTYPFCWRCDTPLIYMASSSWFVRASQLRDRLVAINKKIKWQPKHMQDGRFGKWLAGARDWNVGRSRFWGAPLPIWECDKCQAAKVVTKIGDLGRGSEFDPHRPQIDEVTFKCESCAGGVMRRVPEVFDCWFESGSMPYAQWHYPYEHKDRFDKVFPADFIAEGVDQTRGWFYTLHVLATALFDKPAYKNVVVNGIVQAEDGRKLSKKLRNYPEPDEVFDELGVDALRQYLYSATQIGEDYRFSKRLVAEKARKTLMTVWNVALFYKTYLQGGDDSTDDSSRSLDDWIKSRLSETIENVTKYLDDYDLTRGSRELDLFINDLSLWYVRLSRKRTDKQFRITLARILKDFSIVMAPFTPFIAEAIYRVVRCKEDPQSVHLEDWPQVERCDKDVLSAMKQVRLLVELGHAIRAENGIKVRQPLGAVAYECEDGRVNDALESLLLQELNIAKVAKAAEGDGWVEKRMGKSVLTIDTKLTDELVLEGDKRELVRGIQAWRKTKELVPQDLADIELGDASGVLAKHWSAWKGEIEVQTNSRIVLGKTVSSMDAPTGKAVLSFGEVVIS